jgi:hypothetical protein
MSFPPVVARHGPQRSQHLDVRWKILGRAKGAELVGDRHHSEVLGEFCAGVATLFDPEMLAACVAHGLRVFLRTLRWAG